VAAERVGRAIHSPAKDLMFSLAASAVGRGEGFAAHEAIDRSTAALILTVGRIQALALIVFLRLLTGARRDHT